MDDPVRGGVVIALCALTLLETTPVAAQDVVVTGFVHTSAGVPVARASVRALAAALEVVTSETGQFTLRIPERATTDSDVVRFKRLGFGTREIAIEFRDHPVITLDVELTPLAVRLDELVVTGTAGTQTRRAQAGVVATVSVVDVMETTPLATLPEALRGRVTSLDATPSSGSSGQAQRMWLRGGTSLALSNEPLVFIDGVRADTRLEKWPSNGGQGASRWFDLAPADVERIEIAKGPAAATLYGADASAGVIQIFTRRGSLGRARSSQRLEIAAGAIEPNWRPPHNYARCRAQDVLLTSPAVLCHGQAEGALINDNPLMRERVLRTGRTHALRWQAEGGGAEFGVYASLNMERESGTLPQNRFDRGSFRLNVRWSAAPSLTVDGGFGLMRTWTNVPQNGDNVAGLLAAGLLGNPLTVGGLKDGWFFASAEAIASVEQFNRVLRVTPTLQITHVAGRLNHRLILGMDGSNGIGGQFVPLRTDNAFPGAWSRGVVGEGHTSFQVYSVDYLGNLNVLSNGPTGANLIVSAGAQYVETANEHVGAFGFGLVSNDARRVSDAAERSGSATSLRTRSLGIFVQGEIGYRDRLFLQVATRGDRHSAFGPDAGPQLFPKVGLSFIVADGATYRSRLPLLSTLRARVAYGTSGRAPPQGEAGATYVSAPMMLGPDEIGQGVVPAGPGNPRLRQERGSEIEIGVDGGMLNDHLGVELTYFHKRSDDLLFRQPVPPSTGFPSDPLVNVGSVESRGMEILVEGRRTIGGRAHVVTALGISTLANRLTDLGDVAPFAGSVSGRFMEGRPLGALFDYRVVRVDSAAGQAIVTDTTEFVGGPLPALNVTWGTTVTLFRSLRVHTALEARSGYWQHNMTADGRDRYDGFSERRARASETTVEERLRRFGPFVTESGASVAAVAVRGPYLQDASFIRWRELSVTWDLPAAWLRHVGSKGASLTVAGYNVALWTGYEGDPEAISYIAVTTDGGPNQYGQPNVLTMPQPRRWSARLAFRF